MKALFRPEQQQIWLVAASAGATSPADGPLDDGAALPFYNEAALAQGLSAFVNIPPDAVRINANENPMGPCPEAAEAIHKVIQQGGRYLYSETFAFVALMAVVEGLPRDHILPFAGSSDPLHRAVLAFTGPERSSSWPIPDTRRASEPPGSSARRTIKVPLRKDASHDVQAMAKADARPG